MNGHEKFEFHKSGSFKIEKAITREGKMRFVALSLLVAGAGALDNGVGKLPKMGYNSMSEGLIALGKGADSLCSLQRIRL